MCDVKEIEFGKDNKGRVAMQATREGEIYYLKLFDITKENIEIGTLLKNEKERAEILRLKFYDTRSIDALITQLNKLKNIVLLIDAC